MKRAAVHSTHARRLMRMVASGGVVFVQDVCMFRIEVEIVRSGARGFAGQWAAFLRLAVRGRMPCRGEPLQTGENCRVASGKRWDRARS
jgi:hypothetical protein